MVTSDDPADRQQYNCHGLSFGVRQVLMLDGPTFMKRLAYVETKQELLCSIDEVVALFFKKSNWPDCWHTAKRLRGRCLPLDLYESKCGWEAPPEMMVDEDEEPFPSLGSTAPPAGLQIVHPLFAIRSIYGELHSLWVRGTSPEAEAARRATLERICEGEFQPLEDSAECLDAICGALGIKWPF